MDHWGALTGRGGKILFIGFNDFDQLEIVFLFHVLARRCQGQGFVHQINKSVNFRERGQWYCAPVDSALQGPTSESRRTPEPVH